MARKRKDMTPLEIEFRSYPFRRMLSRHLGSTCVNCGSGEMVEYHHVVPLSLGGTNSLTNIVPLCYACHKAAHNGRHIQHFADHSRSKDGRPPKCDDDTAFRALDLLADGQIGIRKCKEMMHLADRTQPNNTGQYKKWCKLRGIESVRNFLDVKVTNKCRPVASGTTIGEIAYSDGTKKSILCNDTGLNDDTTYVLRFSNIELTYGELKDIPDLVGALRRQRNLSAV